jgi:hypothetical protein
MSLLHLEEFTGLLHLEEFTGNLRRAIRQKDNLEARRLGSGPSSPGDRA